MPVGLSYSYQFYRNLEIYTFGSARFFCLIVMKQVLGLKLLKHLETRSNYIPTFSTLQSIFLRTITPLAESQTLRNFYSKASNKEFKSYDVRKASSSGHSPTFVIKPNFNGHSLNISSTSVMNYKSAYSYISNQRFLSTTVCRVQNHSQYYQSQNKQDKTSSLLYFSSLLVFMVGLAYAAVPLYRMFCQATGLGGDPKIGHKTDKVGVMHPIRERKIHITFNADHHASMQWNFKPSQNAITVVPGETALAFYTAKNQTDKPVVGIATYNVVPFQAGLYFNKIQCFCFEEQWLNPNEEVDMPVFFYIDPDFDDDPQLANTDEIILSYTFFKAEEGQTLPLPGFMKANSVVNLNDKS